MENIQLQNQPRLVNLEEIKVVGLTITHPFQANMERMTRARETFLARKQEIQNTIYPERYICAHFNTEMMFTYCFCMEVSEFGDIPEDMISFTIPKHQYGMTKCSGDPYEDIHNFLNEAGISNNPKALALEVYTFENPKFPDEVDVYIPTRE